ncbi:MAG: S8 family serine peptidase [Bacteroidota bacterium]
MKRQITKFALCIKFSFIIICTFGAFKSQAQTTTFRVFFKDKGPVSFVKNNSLYNETLAIFNERALERRRKVLKEDSLITLTDAPVYARYVDSLQNLGAKVLVKLRWKNYAVVEVDSAIAESFKSFSFVEKVQQTREKMTTLSFKNVQDYFFKNSQNTSLVFTDNCGQFGYGRSFNQAQMLNVPALHAMGFTGKGALTGFLDNGFRWKSHNALKDISVVAEYDFVFQDSITANESNDVSSQDGHGTPVLSTVAGYLQDSIIGIAPMADFILAKTEDMRFERRIEEDNYAAGVEWMESRGSDVISSSLGYYEFTEEATSYSYDELNGKTSITAQAVNHAVALGVVCLSAAGNEGPNDRTLITPGDADSVISCAAVTPQGVAAGFSSRGPRADSLLKPDIAAQGLNVVVVATGTKNSVVNTSGTSFSTPITAGNVTLLLSAFPELRPWEVRNSLYSSGSQANAKDAILGYGIPDMVKAFKRAGIAISPLALIPNDTIQKVFTYILSDEFPSAAELSVRFKNESTFRQFPLKAGDTTYLYYADIPTSLFKNSVAEAFVTAQNSASARRMPFKNSEYVTLDPSRETVPCGMERNVLQKPDTLPTLFSTPFPSIVYAGTDHISVRVSVGDEESAELSVFNIIGQLMYSSDKSNRKGAVAEVQIPTGNLPTGSYIVHIRHGNSLEFAKFVVSR